MKRLVLLLPLLALAAAPARAADPATNAAAADAAVHAKLNRLVLEDIEFQKAHVADVVSFLVSMSEELDHSGSSATRGIPIVLDFDESEAGDSNDSDAGEIPLITIRAKSVSFRAVLDTIAEMTGLQYRVANGRVEIKRGGGNAVANSANLGHPLLGAVDGNPTAGSHMVCILPEASDDRYRLVAVTNSAAFHGVRFAFLDAVQPTQTNLCFAVSGNGCWAAASFRNGRGADAGELPEAATEAVLRALGHDIGRLVADSGKRVPCGFDVRDDVPSHHFEVCRLPDGFLENGTTVSFSVSRWTTKDQETGRYRTEDAVVASAGLDSVILSRHKPGDGIDQVNVLCFNHETGMPLGGNYQYTRQDDGTWSERPVEERPFKDSRE
jgi:hypothetical protein